MKKVININFQGRVVPIEESAYDILKQYVDSLRKFFAKEEGRDEIINDIEGRIAELFVDSLKKGNTCVTDENVNSIIASMGRPEDFESDENRVHSQLEDETSKQKTEGTGHESSHTAPKGRLYRNGSDKILGGVCSGIADYLRVDPTIVRIIFAIISFGAGTGIVLYILLWAILPSQRISATSSLKRLYRNPDDKVIAGVASGISNYFNIAVWIPRLIFVLPLVSGILVSTLKRSFWFDWDPFPGLLFGSFGGTLFVVYVVLWAVIPQARSASEKLEMRGEKVDLNTIKNTIQEDLEGFKTRSEKWSGDVKEQARQFATEFSQTVTQKNKQFGREAGYTIKSNRSRIGNAIGIVFKAFFLFIAGILVFVLLGTVIALMTAGVDVFPLKNFFLQGVWQNFLAWCTLLLFLGVPILAFITWLIRRIMGVQSKNKYLGFTFSGLWTIGLITGIMLIISIARNFDAMARDIQDVAITQPATGKLIVKVANSPVKVISRLFKMDGVLSIHEDSLFLNNIKLSVVKSKDTSYHITATRFSNGRNETEALGNLKEINYSIHQQDSTIWLNRGFAVQRGTRFRNQAVALTLHVPVGKRIIIDRSVHRKLNWFHVNMDSHDWGWEEDWNNDEQEHYWYTENVEYVMTPGGLEKVEEKEKETNNDSPEKEKDAVEKYKQGREELRKAYDKKVEEAEELKKELDKPVDTIKNQLKKSTSLIKPDTNKKICKRPIKNWMDNRLALYEI